MHRTRRLVMDGLVFGAMVIAYVIRVLGVFLATLAVGAGILVSRVAAAKGFPLGLRVNHGPVPTVDMSPAGGWIEVA